MSITEQTITKPTVQDVLSILAYGNFRSIATSQEGLGFKSSQLPTMMSFINPAIQEVFNRFNLGMNKVKVVFEDGRKKYAINKNYAYSVVGETGTIDDTIQNPLTGTVSSIVFVETEDEYVFSINDRSEEYLVTSSNPSFITINDTLLSKEKGLYLYIVTQPTKLPLDTSDSVKDLELDIPEHFLEVVALCAAKLYYSSSGSKENVQRASLFNTLYEQAVQVLMDSGAKQDMEFFSPAEDMREWA